MTDDEARALVLFYGGKEAVEHTTAFVDLVIAENNRQNLIAPSTIDSIWTRHVADSVQLLGHLPNSDPLDWVDIGTGGGFPGLAIAIASSHRVVLVEPRRRRAEFLLAGINQLGLERRVTVRQQMIERISEKFDVISARAVAPVEKLLRDARHCAKPRTRWLLPRGRISDEELSMLNARTMFHVKQSVTDVTSAILIVDGTVAL